LNQES